MRRWASNFRDWEPTICPGYIFSWRREKLMTTSLPEAPRVGGRLHEKTIKATEWETRLLQAEQNGLDEASWRGNLRSNP